MTKAEHKAVFGTIKEIKKIYPKNIFPENGKTPDAIAAKAIRFICGRIEEDIKEKLEEIGS